MTCGLKMSGIQVIAGIDIDSKVKKLMNLIIQIHYLYNKMLPH